MCDILASVVLVCSRLVVSGVGSERECVKSVVDIAGYYRVRGTCLQGRGVWLLPGL